jgi:hypothetical protein
MGNCGTRFLKKDLEVRKFAMNSPSQPLDLFTLSIESFKNILKHMPDISLDWILLVFRSKVLFVNTL